MPLHPCTSIRNGSILMLNSDGRTYILALAVNGPIPTCTIWSTKYILSECDGLYMIGPGSEPIRRCGIVGVGVLLWVWG